MDKIARVLGWVATLFGISLSFFVFLSVVMRYFLGTPFHFTEELVGLLFCAMSFLSFAIAESHGHHIRLELLTKKLGPKVRWVPNLFSLIVLVCFSGVLFYHGFNYMLFSYRINARTDASDLLIYPWVLVLLIGLFVFISVTVMQKARSIRNNPDSRESG